MPLEQSVSTDAGSHLKRLTPYNIWSHEFHDDFFYFVFVLCVSVSFVVIAS